MQRVVGPLPAGARGAVLGVTPEFFSCEWPRDASVLAVDHSRAMMQKLWPPVKKTANASAVIADWTSIPVASDTFDVVLGDGCYIVFGYPQGYLELTREVVRVLRRGGMFVIRVFVRPDRSESVDEIADAFASARIENINVMKLRLLAALHGASGIGTRLDDAWSAWKAMPAMPSALVGKRGWTPEELTSIDAYRGKEMRYYLPTMQEFRAIASPHLEEIDCAFGSDQLAERCPTFVFRRRAV